MRLTRKDFLAGLASVGGLAGCRTAETPSVQEDGALGAWRCETGGLDLNGYDQQLGPLQILVNNNRDYVFALMDIFWTRVSTPRSICRATSTATASSS